MRAVKNISDPEAFQLLADETRRKIVYLLRAKEMTVSQISAELGLTAQAIYHHIRKMKDAELVEVAREERVGHFIETYYQATAEMFHLTQGECKKSRKEKIKDSLAGLEKLGFEVECDSKTVTKLVKICEKSDNKCGNENDFDSCALEEDDFFTQQMVMEYAKLIAMDDKDFENFLSNYKELRDALKSCAKAPKTVKKAKKKKD